MTLTAFLLIGFSAILHATWNLMAKKGHMSVAFYATLCSVCAVVCTMHTFFWTPIRIASMPSAFWWSLAGSVASDCGLYCIGLKLVYRRMEMASAYPVMRSLPIILTAVVTMLFGIGKPLTSASVIGFVIVFAGALLMPLNKFSDLKLSNYLSSNMLFLLIVACGTTGYTIFDSRALSVMRANVSPEIAPWIISITYYAVREIGLGTSLWVMVACSGEERRNVREIFRKRDFTPVFAGVCAGATYLLVLIAMNYVTNVSYVQVFRQIGLPVGMLAGILILKEKGALVKWIGVTLIIAGLAISVLKF